MQKLINRAFAATMIAAAMTVSCTKDQLSKESLKLDMENGKAPTKTTTNTTGQGIMIDFDVKGEYANDGIETYEFNEEAGAALFTHISGEVAGAPTYNETSSQPTETSITTSTTLPAEFVTQYFGGVSPAITSSYTGTACTPAAPTEPTAPAQIAAKLTLAVDNNKCTLLTGGDLTSVNYSQTASATASCTSIISIKYGKLKGTNCWYKTEVTKSRTYTWTYNYTVAPINVTVAARTAWELVSSDFNGVQIPVSAKIAGLSAKTWTGGKKYSFALSYIDPILGEISRISNLKVELLDINNNPVLDELGAPILINAPHNIGTNYDVATGTVPTVPNTSGALDFKYITNAGSNGDVSLLPNALNGPVDARTLLNTDAFTGNQNGGADGKALQLAVMPNQNVKIPGTVPAGSYKIRISCNVKGNDGTLDAITALTQDIKIRANCKK